MRHINNENKIKIFNKIFPILMYFIYITIGSFASINLPQLHSVSVFADHDDDHIAKIKTGCKLFNATLCEELYQTLNWFLIPTLQTIIVGMAAIFVLVSAIQYITSGAEEKADTKKAQATLTNAAIGLIIALLLVVILNVVKTIVGRESGAFGGTSPAVVGGFTGD